VILQLSHIRKSTSTVDMLRNGAVIKQGTPEKVF